VSHLTWRQVWEAKGTGEPVTPDSAAGILQQLMEMDGYFSPTSSTSLADHEVQFRYIVDAMGIGPDDSVYEVGCGAGALLYWLRDRCASVAGCDFSESLVRHARAALPGGTDLRQCEATEVEPIPRYDVVISNGVFIYFPDRQYARQVVDRMVAKARRAVGIFDVNDAGRREEAEAARREHQASGRQDYRGLEQLYLPRSFFTAIATEHGLRSRIEDSPMPNSANARFRYHVSLTRD
jgi:cyclopropane fatty-acyl-phospholipid synthase-like methyltransferase